MAERKIIKKLTELNTPLDKLLVIPSYHKGNLLPRFKNTFMYLDKGITFPILLFLQDKQDIEQYSWVREDIIFWCPEEPELVDIAKVRWYIVEMRCVRQKTYLFYGCWMTISDSHGEVFLTVQHSTYNLMMRNLLALRVQQEHLLCS